MGSSATLEELIRRQRELLKQTFMHSQLPPVSASSAERLAASQREILTATEEFTAKLRQPAGTVPPLEQAMVHMQGATAALDEHVDGSGRDGAALLAEKQPPDEAALKRAQGLEESALASLIEARQNLRQILQMSNSPQASQCRQLDRQQQQKLRPPKQERKPDDAQRQQQLAQACQQLQQMAEQQQQWSEQACPSSSSAGRPRASSLDPSSRQALSDQQQGAIQQGEQVKQQLEESQRGGQLAEPQLDRAIEGMQEALDQLHHERRQEAARAAEQVAERLRELARHLESLNEPDFGQRLSQACGQAQQLADRQQALADAARGVADAEQEKTAASGAQTAEQQRRLAERGAQLDELLARLAAEALDQPAEVRRMIQDVREANPTGEIVELMQAAAEDFEANRDSRAVPSSELASRGLRRLATDLQAIRERYTQPDLEQLLAAEQQAADLLQKMASGRNAGERALARSQLEELQRTLDRLAAGDERLARALDELRGRTDRSSAHVEQAPDVAGSAEARFAQSDQVLADGLRQVTEALQKRIQAAVLDRALQAPDDAVPPGYEKMVEEYYRAMSEDLR